MITALKQRLRANRGLYQLARDLYQPAALLGASVWGRQQLQPVRAIEDQIRAIELQRPPREPHVLIFDAAPQGARLTCHTTTSRAIGWSLRLAGQSVRYAVCRSGVPKCFYSYDALHPLSDPPCTRCAVLRSAAYPADLTSPLLPQAELWAEWRRELSGLPLHDLERYRYQDLELGRICAASVRWALRRHTLEGDEVGRALLIRYLVGALSLSRSFDRLLDELQPRAVVTYNDAFFAEATVAEVVRRRQIPLVTHEIGWVPGRMFVAHGQATRYQIPLPPGYELSPAAEAKLEAYLSKRFAGDFRMGATNFWPEIKTLSPALRERMARYRQVVSVFTNVVFDTSQLYANVVFDDMFDWIDGTLDLARQAPDTLFIIRVHPDEYLKNTKDTVAGWLDRRPDGLPENVVLVPPNEYISSYDLVRVSKFVVVYNSTIGLEAMILGKRVVCGGETRYLGSTAAVRPDDRDGYGRLIKEYLAAGRLNLDEESQLQARRYLYYTYFEACLDLSPWIGTGLEVDDDRLGDAMAYHPDRSAEMGILVRGVLDGRPFTYA